QKTPAKGIIPAEEAGGEPGIGFKMGGTREAARGFFVTTKNQLEDRRRRVRPRVAVSGGARLPRRFAEPVMRLDRSVAPAEHRLEMPSKGEIGIRHRICRVQ